MIGLNDLKLFSTADSMTQGAAQQHKLKQRCGFLQHLQCRGTAPTIAIGSGSQCACVHKPTALHRLTGYLKAMLLHTQTQIHAGNCVLCTTGEKIQKIESNKSLKDRFGVHRDPESQKNWQAEKKKIKERGNIRKVSIFK